MVVMRPMLAATATQSASALAKSLLVEGVCFQTFSTTLVSVGPRTPFLEVPCEGTGELVGNASCPNGVCCFSSDIVGYLLCCFYLPFIMNIGGELVVPDR